MDTIAANVNHPFAMATLLRLDASSRLDGSHSRQLADRFIDHWQTIDPQCQVIERDLIRQPIPHIAQATITGFYTPVSDYTPELQQAVGLANELIAELKAADVLLISTPMYNFSVPSALKAWIDHVVRAGETFSFSPETGFQGLVHDKRAFVLTAAGAVFSTEAMQPFDFLSPYLKTLLSFLGIADIEIISLEGTTIDAAAFERSQQVALNKISQVQL